MQQRAPEELQKLHIARPQRAEEDKAATLLDVPPATGKWPVELEDIWRAGLVAPPAKSSKAVGWGKEDGRGHKRRELSPSA